MTFSRVAPVLTVAAIEPPIEFHRDSRQLRLPAAVRPGVRLNNSLHFIDADFVPAVGWSRVSNPCARSHVSSNPSH
jgi:hypothetical protein